MENGRLLYLPAAEKFKLYPATFLMSGGQPKFIEEAYQEVIKFYKKQLTDKMLPITLRYLCTLKSFRLMGRSLLVFLGLIYKPLSGVRQGRAGRGTGLGGG